MSTKPVKKKRERIWVEYDAERKLWWVRAPLVFETRDEAIEFAKDRGRVYWSQFRKASEVIVRTKSGNIGVGRGSRTTFGRDPRRSVG